MQKPIDVSEESASRPSASWKRIVASLVSYTINPFILTPLLLALTLAYFGAPWEEWLFISGLALAFYTFLPLMYLFHLIRTRRARSVDVPVREHRTRPILGGFLSSLVGLAVIALRLETARTLVLALLVLHLFHVLFLLAITQRTKISLHLFSLSSFTAVLLALQIYSWPYPAGGIDLFPWWLLSLLLIPLLMWARVHLRIHTVSEVMLGFLLGQMLPLLELYLLHVLLG